MELGDEGSNCPPLFWLRYCFSFHAASGYRTGEQRLLLWEKEFDLSLSADFFPGTFAPYFEKRFPVFVSIDFALKKANQNQPFPIQNSINSV